MAQITVNKNKNKERSCRPSVPEDHVPVRVSYNTFEIEHVRNKSRGAVHLVRNSPVIGSSADAYFPATEQVPLVSRLPNHEVLPNCEYCATVLRQKLG